MRIGIISDVHGNYIALRTVLDYIGEVDSLWCLGDLVGYGPQPNECIEAVRKYPHLCIPGNHDWGMLGRLEADAFNPDARAVLQWTHRNLTPDNMAYMEALPVSIKAFGQCFTLVHASPRDPMWEYLLDLFDAAECFPLFNTRYCFVGHTHVPLIFRDVSGVVKAILPETGETLELNVWPKTDKEEPSSPRMIINPGSVGQPRDGDPRAAFMVFDVPDGATLAEWDWTGMLTFARIEYDIKATQSVMRSLGFPQRLISRLELGL